MMEDDEFIAYCEGHSTTELALFSGAQVARLLSLAGDPHGNAEEWQQHHSSRFVSRDLTSLCALARARITDQSL